MDWFLYDGDLRQERVNKIVIKNNFPKLTLSCLVSKNSQTYFKNLVVWTLKNFKSTFRTIFNIMHEGVNNYPVFF